MSDEFLGIISYPGMLKVLRWLDSAGSGMTIRQLATDSEVTYSGTYAIVHKLEKAGLVRIEQLGAKAVVGRSVILLKPIPAWLRGRPRPLPRRALRLSGADIELPGIRPFQLVGSGERAFRKCRSVAVWGPSEPYATEIDGPTKVVLALVLEGRAACEVVRKLTLTDDELTELRDDLHLRRLYGRARYFGLAKLIGMRPPRRTAPSQPKRRRTRSDARRPQEAVE